MTVILKNNAVSTLTTAISASDTGIVVASGAQFPTLAGGEYFYATLVSPAGTTEIIKVTARVGNSMTVVRAQDGTSAASFQVGSLVEMRVNAASIRELRDEASEISIADTGGYYTATSVEGALQEVGATLQDSTTRATVAALLADTVFTYTSGTPGSVVAGEVVRTREEGFAYKVAPAAASDHHVVTAGGVKLYVIATQVMYLKAFAPVGDGIADDRTKIQAAIDLTPVGGTLIFDGLPHRINSKLTMTKTMNIDFANSRIIINNSSSPSNQLLNIYSLTDTPVTWTESVTKGMRTFAVAAPGIAVGDYVVLMLGVNADPYDPNEEQYVRVCRVTANTGTAVTVDIRAPYNITGTNHSIRKITSLVANCTVKNLQLDYVGGTVPDTFILPYWCFGLTLENIHSVKSRIAINAFDQHNLTIRNLTGYVERVGITSHGRAITMWQVENSVVENVSISNAGDGGALVLLESWCRDVEFRRIEHFDMNTAAGLAPPITINGGSYGILIDGFRLDTNASRGVIDNTGQPSEFWTRNIRLKKHPKSFAHQRCESFADEEKGVDFLGPNQLITTRREVLMQPSWSDVGVNICRGVVRRLWVNSANVAELDSLYVFNSSNQGPNIKSALAANTWYEAISSWGSLGKYGSDYPFNDPAIPQKKLTFYTTASMPVNTKFTVVAEFWPIIGTSSGLFPITELA